MRNDRHEFDVDEREEMLALRERVADKREEVLELREYAADEREKELERREREADRAHIGREQQAEIEGQISLTAHKSAAAGRQTGPPMPEPSPTPAEAIHAETPDGPGKPAGWDPIARAKALRCELATMADQLARTEYKVAASHEQRASRGSGKAATYQDLAKKAREAADNATEVARHFAS